MSFSSRLPVLLSSLCPLSLLPTLATIVPKRVDVIAEYPQPKQFAACAGKVQAVALTPDGPRALLAVVEYLEGVTKRSRGEVVMAMRDALGWDPADKIIHVEEYIHEQGRLAGQQELLKSLLERRFGDVPEAAVKHIQVASFPEIEAMTERLLKANTIDDVLGKKRQRKTARKAATSTPRRR